MTAGAMLGWADALALAVYVAFTLWLGYLFRGVASRGMAQYFLAGRNMPMVILFATTGATFMSGIGVVGGPAQAVKAGVAILIFNSIAMNILRWGTTLFGSYLRRVVPKEVMTMSDLTNFLFGDKTGNVITACLNVLFNLARVGAQFLAMGFLLNYLFGISTISGCIISLGIALIYTALAGFWADCVTDFVQSAIMMLGMAVAAIFGLVRVGGWQGVVSSLTQSGFHTQLHWMGPYNWVGLLSLALMSLFMYPDPAMIQRYIAARTPGQVKASQSFVILNHQIWHLAAYMMAFVALAMFPKLKGEPAIYAALHEVLPPVLFGVWVAAFVSACLSTVDTHLLISGVALVRDIYQKAMGRRLEDRKAVTVTRVMIGVVGILAVVLATQFKAVWDMFAWSSEMLTAAIFIPLLAGLVWKGRKHPAALWISMAAALAVYVGLIPPIKGMWPWSAAVAKSVWAERGVAFFAAWLLSAGLFFLVNLAFGKEVKKETEKESLAVRPTGDRPAAAPAEVVGPQISPETQALEERRQATYHKIFLLCSVWFFVVAIAAALGLAGVVPAQWMTVVWWIAGIELLVHALILLVAGIPGLVNMYRVAYGKISYDQFCRRFL